jgi:hypothetical protein
MGIGRVIQGFYLPVHFTSLWEEQEQEQEQEQIFIAMKKPSEAIWVKG